MPNRHFRRNRLPQCVYHFFDRSTDPTRRGHQSVAVCLCQQWGSYGTTKETGHEQWESHVAQVASGEKPERMLHQ